MVDGIRAIRAPMAEHAQGLPRALQDRDFVSVRGIPDTGGSRIPVYAR